jgi:hypothetical protein
MDGPTAIPPDEEFELLTVDVDDHAIPEHHPDVLAAYRKKFQLVGLVHLDRRDKTRLFFQRRIR